MSEPVDPIKFDFGVSFSPAGERIRGEADQRIELAKREVSYHHGFLDDILRAISPHDLVLIGAETGAGKTALATSIAKNNAKAGKRVYYIALEAEPNEIERRIKYELLVEFAQRDNQPWAYDLDYADWYRGKHEDKVGRYNFEAERLISLQYANLHTYYRGSKFDHDDMHRLFLAIQDKADLIILDHLHYVDIDDENENRGFKKTVKMIRDVSLGIGRPVILIAHLRKRDIRSKAIVPDIEMFHGSSDIIKICTRVVMLAPCRSIPPSKWYQSNTFFHVPKDRVSGATGYVALCRFDRRFKNYDPYYTLGRSSPNGEAWEAIPFNDAPRWAKNHRSSP